MITGIMEGLGLKDGAPPESDGEKMWTRFVIDKGKKYGEGGYGATYGAKDKESPSAPDVAVKVIDTRRMRKDAIMRETSILESLEHPNVIRVLAHGSGRAEVQQGHLYFIFMEVASGGELFDQVIDNGANAMPEHKARGFMTQLLAGVAHCHKRGVAHRDLKLENVLLTSTGVVKVIDFGLSHVYPRDADGRPDRSTALKECCGSKSYAAPEVLNQRGYDGFAADVWSLGVCLFAMVSGFFPLDEATKKDWRYDKLLENQSKGRSTVRSVYGWYKRPSDHLTPALVDLLDNMLMMEPSKRASMAEVLAHPWLQGPTAAGGVDASGVAAGEGFDAAAQVGDGEAPQWRTGISVVGEGVPIDDAMEYDDPPVYRSLGLKDASEVPLPKLGRQTAFGRADDELGFLGLAEF